MGKIRFLGAALASVLCLATAAQAELNTFTYVSHDGNGDGKYDGDLTGVGPVTLYDGEGGDMWNGGDQYAYLHDENRVQGDFTATVRVVAQTESVEGRWGKAGLNANVELDGRSRHVATVVAAGTGSQAEPPTTGDHSRVPVRITGRTNNDATGGFEVGIVDSTGAEIVNNVFPEPTAGVVDPATNVSWLRLQYKADTNSFISGFAPDVDGAPGEWGYSPVVNNVEAAPDGWYVGLSYSAHNSLQLADVQDEDGMHGITFDNYSIVDEYLLPATAVNGVQNLLGSREGLTYGDPVETQGLSQFWYDGNMRANPEAFLDAGDTGSEEFPLLNPGGQPFASETTWWRGSQGQPVTGLDLPNYPASLAGTRFEGSDNEDNYAVRLTGEIFIEEDGDYLIRDGIDDFTMIAIDQDGDGVLEDLDGVVNGDVGQAPFGDVLVLDDDWADLDGNSQEAAYHGFAEMDGVAAGGEWRKIEIWMSEGGGGDGGIVYMANLDDPDVFDDTDGAALSQEARDKFAIDPTKLRSMVAPLTGGTASAALRTDIEYVMEVGNENSDQIAVDDADGVLTTALDVAGATIRIDAADDLAEGTSIQLFDADSVANVDDLTLNFADPSAWDLSQLSEGIITFGAATGCNPNSMGDLNGDGSVGFPDFLILSANFGNDAGSHTEGDINCDGSVGFPDFLILSANFGNTVGQAASVPEPAGFAMLAAAGALCGLARRRRR